MAIMQRIVTFDVSRNVMHNAGMSDDPTPSRHRDRRTARFAAGRRVPAFQGFERQAYWRLEILEATPSKDVLKMLLSNRFEALGGDRAGQFSIRINDQWRICFEWPGGDDKPSRIEIVDYH